MTTLLLLLLLGPGLCWMLLQMLPELLSPCCQVPVLMCWRGFVALVWHVCAGAECSSVVGRAPQLCGASLACLIG